MNLKSRIKSIVPSGLLDVYHKTLARTAAFLYGNPSRKLIVIGVTGTKGKSTTANLIAFLLDFLGSRTGLTSTIQFKVGEHVWLNDKKMTMLGRFATQKLLRDMVRGGCEYAIIETSSEGIKQWRHLGIEYDVAVFTNLTPEHIESHGSFENYRDAKEQLFKHLTRFPAKTLRGKRIQKSIITNADDPESARILTYNADKKITYGLADTADLRLHSIQLTETGSSFTVNGEKMNLQLMGTFNIYNALAAIATVATQGHELHELAPAVSHLEPLPGRQEFINEGQPYKIMVDYAYEPESQRQLYELLQTIRKKRIIHVTGSAGGGRDRSRRPILGSLAAERADIVIVTNEDPYDEDPKKIIQEVAAGARQAGKKDSVNLFVISDREAAIGKALSLARTDDLVLITGKGSEQALCVANGKKIPWDDRGVVKKYLKNNN